MTTWVSLNFQYGAAYPPNQYGAPPGPYPGTPAANGQVHHFNRVTFIITDLIDEGLSLTL